MKTVISKLAAPGYRLLKIEAQVANCDTPVELWREIEQLSDSLRQVMVIADINKRPAIAATRDAYKACGKDPNRYRPSSEALCRRILKGQDLYRVNAVVDAINLLSLKSGHSIGAFDMDKIAGDTITLVIGEELEPYEGIGRGTLNIAGMPVWRDAVGGIGTPTSDNERTKVTLTTTALLITVNIYGHEMDVDAIVTESRRLLETYCGTTSFEHNLV